MSLYSVLALMRHSDLTVNQASALNAIYRGVNSMSDVARECEFESTSIAQSAVKYLITKGLVTRSKPKTTKPVTFNMTSKGCDVLLRLFEAAVD